MKLACNDCPDYNSKECLSCKYINRFLISVDKGRKKKECLSDDGAVPPLLRDYPDYKQVLYDNSMATKAIKLYLSSPEKNKAVIALYLAGFEKTKIAELLNMNRSTVYRTLEVFI